jgi:hypothetical protein
VDQLLKHVPSVSDSINSVQPELAGQPDVMLVRANLHPVYENGIGCRCSISYLQRLKVASYSLTRTTSATHTNI